MDSPGILVEIMALDHTKVVEFYTNVFGWHDEGHDGFAFMRFSPIARPLFGAIAKAREGVPGWEKGIMFYIQVEHLESALEKIETHGGRTIVDARNVEQYGFRFAMFEDIEQNIVGLIEPHTPSAG